MLMNGQGLDKHEREKYWRSSMLTTLKRKRIDLRPNLVDLALQALTGHPLYPR